MTWKPQAIGFGMLGVVATLAVWEASVRISGGGPVPPALDVLAGAATQLATTRFWTSLGSTFAQWFVGLGLACVVAIPLGLLLGRSAALRAYTQSTIDFLRATPGVALLPLFVLVFGSGLEMVALLVAFVAGWQLLIPTIAGAASVDPQALDTARVFNLGRTRTFIRVVLPAASPFIATGLRLASTVGLLVAVGAELIVGSPGIGNLMLLAELSGNEVALFSLCVLAGALGLLVNLVLVRLEHWYLGWHISASGRAEEA